MKRFAQPEPIRAASADWTTGSAQGEPAVLWYHDVDLKHDDAEVELRASGKPLLVTRRDGRGQVNVFLGAALGDFSERNQPDRASGRFSREPVASAPRLISPDVSTSSASNPTPFWLWDGWPGWVRRMVQMTASTNEEQ